MTIADLITMVRLKVNDKETIEFTDDEMLSFVNDGIRFIREIYMDEMPDLLSEFDSVDLDQGENRISIPEKLLKITEVRCNGKKMHYTNTREIEDLTCKGIPKLYVVGKGTLFVFPIPQERVTVSYEYIEESPMYGFLDEFPYPNDFAQYVQEYATVRIGTIIGADMSMETQVFSQLRNSVVNSIQKLVPDVCVVNSYY